ncbi:MAG TPA: DUF4386 domain-containing protein [Chloroflexia bacterium]
MNTGSYSSREGMHLSKNTARWAGLLWLLSTITGSFGLLVIRTSVLVPGDAGATAGNVMTSEFLYRAAIVGILLGQIFLFFLGLTLFDLFKEADRRTAKVLLASAMLTVGIAVVNTLNQLGALLVLSRPDFLKVFSTEQLDALALLLLRLANSSGQGLIEIFWAPFYFSLGLLILRSRYLPRVFGILLMLMGTGFAINIFQKFLLPQFYPAVFTQLAMLGGALGGIPTMFWLLIRGAKLQPLEAQTS